jgi:hypothetical protein
LGERVQQIESATPSKLRQPNMNPKLHEDLDEDVA